MPPKGARVRCRTGIFSLRFFAHGFFVSDRINRMDKMTSENVKGENSVDSVHSVEKPLPNGAIGTSDKDGKAATSSGERGGSRTSFNSKKTYVSGKLHPDIRVPFREISLAPTKSTNGEIEINEPVRVYDTSGPWGDADFHGDVTQGLPPLRSKWIRDRSDVEEYDGRKVQPIDDGYLSESHAERAERKRLTSNVQPASAVDGLRRGERPTSKSESENGAGSNSVLDVRGSAFGVSRRVLRAKSNAVTQLYYARKGIITPEMEFIAIRENSGANRRNPKPEIRNPKQIRNSKFEIPSTFDIRHSALPATISRISTAEIHLVQTSQTRSHPNLCGPKSPAAAPLFRQTSIIPNPSR